jgi:hypothetical protein
MCNTIGGQASAFWVGPVLATRGLARAPETFLVPTAAVALRRQSRLDGWRLPSGLEAVAPLIAISARHALSLSEGSDPGRCA